MIKLTLTSFGLGSSVVENQGKGSNQLNTLYMKSVNDRKVMN